MARNTRLLYDRIIDTNLNTKAVAKSLAYFIFREIIEEVHAKYNISQDEIKAMNRKAVNRAAAFLECTEDKERFAALVGMLSLETTDGITPKRLLTPESSLSLPRVKQKDFGR